MSRPLTIAAIVATAATSTALGQAIASPTATAGKSALRAQDTRLKQPAATTANVHGLRSYVGGFVTAIPNNLGLGGVAFATVRCPGNLHAVSGGWDSADNTPDAVDITSNELIRGDKGWLVGAIDQSTDASAPGFKFRATVLCG